MEITLTHIFMSTEDIQWIRNPKGVVSAIPARRYNEYIKRHGWEPAVPEEVPLFKVYTDDGELTENGERRRKTLMDRAARRAIKPAPAPQAAPIPTLAPDLRPATGEKSIEDKVRDSDLLTPEEYRKISWMDLRSYAALRGIDVTQRGLTKDVLLNLLDSSAVQA